jgi:hypothetical protein
MTDAGIRTATADTTSRLGRRRVEAALLISFLAGWVSSPALASLCSDTVQQLQTRQRADQGWVTAQLLDAQKVRTDAETDCATAYGNATIGTADQAKIAAAQQARHDCVTAAARDYNTTSGALTKARTDIDAEYGKARVQLTGSCAWTPQQVNGLISALGQSISQIEQGTAQIISASRGSKPASSSASDSSKPAGKGSSDETTRPNSHSPKPAMLPKRRAGRPEVDPS